MGLDMYLEAEELVWRPADYEKVNPIKIKIRKEVHSVYPWMERTNKDGYIRIVKEIGYWRKASQIHSWFVKNVQEGCDECQRSYVSKEHLIELLDLCRKVKKDHTKADKLLPTAPGFFFGGTEYDEYYFNDIDETIKILEAVLANVPDASEIYYHASW